MIRSLWTSASGMNTQQMTIDVIANNLANANTTGFKKSRANFQDLMYQTHLIAGAATAAGGQIPTGIQAGMGSKTASVQKIYTQGDYVQTGNQLDMAIEGNGFFQVLRGDELLYTRAGNFTKDSEGFITTAEGDRLQPEVQIPAEATVISMQSDGTMTIYGDREEILQTNNIPLWTFINPTGLFSTGHNLLRPTEGSGDAIEGVPGTDGAGTIANNFVEMSNVSVVDEMVQMIIGQRTYEANSKTVQTSDTMLGLANGLKR